MKVRKMFSLKTLSTTIIACAALLYSCKKDNENQISSADSQNANSESVSAAITTETADMGTSVVANTNDTQLSGARVAASQTDWVAVDGRLKGATITITPANGSTFNVPQGTITINFGSGQTDAYGVTRKGLITINYYGRRFKTGSYRSIHFTGYSRTANSNTITFSDAMVYTVTNVTDSTATPLKLRHVLENGTLTFSADNTTIIRNSNMVVAWDKTAGTVTFLAKTADITDSAWGTSRKGVNYTMDITKDLVHKVSCLGSNVYIPVSGTKLFRVGVGTNATVEYTIDYGDGTCDNTVTVTFGGKTVTVSTNGNGD